MSQMEAICVLVRGQIVLRQSSLQQFSKQYAAQHAKTFSSKPLLRTPPLLSRTKKIQPPSNFVSRRLKSSTRKAPFTLHSRPRTTPPRITNTRVARRPQSTHNKPPTEPKPHESKSASDTAADGAGPDVTSNLGSPQSPSLSERLRKLSREYGWSALGVYLGLSALDFPFCFLAVRMLGTERIGHWEHIIVDSVWNIISLPMEGVKRGMGMDSSQESQATTTQEMAVVPQEGGGDGVALPGDKPQEWSWGVEEAQEANQSEATIWTQLALAYAIHKSFIFLRVPLTAAVTPKVVRVLRSWGWNIGKRKPKPSQ